MNASKILFSLFLLLFLTHPSFSQGWQRVYTGIAQQDGDIRKIIPAPDGGFLLLLSEEPQDSGNLDLHIVKIDDNGAQVWVKDYDFGANEYAADLIATSDGGFIVLYSIHPASNTLHYSLLKLDAQFNVVSLQEIAPGGDVVYVRAIKMIETNQEIHVFGTAYYYGAPGAEGVDTGFKMRFDLSGNTLGYDEWNQVEDQFTAVTLAANGDFITTCQAYGGLPQATGQILISRVNAMGNATWNQTIAESSVHYLPTDVVPAPDGGFVVAGWRNSDGYLRKIDDNGQMVWEKWFPYNPDSFNTLGFNKIVPTADGTGYWAFSPTYTSIQQVVLQRLDLQGNKLWSKALGPDFTYSSILSAIGLPDGVIAGGYLKGAGNNYHFQPVVFRTDNAGNTYHSGIKGTIVDDLNGDCIGDSDSLYFQFILQVWQNGSFVNTTTADLNGEFHLPLDTGTYLITILKPTPSTTFCPDTITVTVIPQDTVDHVDFTAFNSPQPVDSVYGYVFEDVDGDCIHDPFEITRSGWTVIMFLYGQNSIETFQTVTDSNGYYSFTNLAGFTTLATGAFSISAPQNDGLNCTVTCPQALNFDFSNGTSTQVDMGVHCDSLPPCPVMHVDIAASNFRPCMPSEYFVNYCNIGAVTAINASIDVTIDPNLEVTGSNIPWNAVNGNIYTFELGNILPEQCGNFSITVFTPCSDLSGTTYCSEAHAYPDSSCAAPGANWDGSQIKVTADCVNGEVNFKIANIGTGNMAEPLGYVVIEDNVLLMTAPESFQLDANDSQIVSFQPNGATLRMEADQSTGFPGMSLPAAWVEGCVAGSGNISLGFVNQYPLGDQDPWLDVFCLESVNSFDPNDKQGFPRGVSDEHYIKQNTDLDYLIRFQNTGTALALQVELRDTIPVAFLDPATVHPGASSHPYQFDLQGDGVIVFKFPNINLPDTSAGDAASQGFVHFRVSQRKDLPLGTKIKNEAAIYFDFNAPIITNQTLHTIGDNFLLVNAITPSRPDLKVSVAPNPMENKVLINVDGPDDLQNLHFRLLSAMGRLLGEGNFTGKRYTFDAGNLPAGIYFYEIMNEEKVIATGKMTKG